MKRLPWIFLFLSICFTAAGQRSADYGIFAGASSYLGDINPNRLLYSPLPAGGLFYRYNFNPRQALRANLFFGGIRADDLDFNNSFQQNRAISFSGFVGELIVQYEFNFLPYTTQGKLWDYTPYVAAGAGVAFIDATYAFEPVIPFSVGFKANIHKNMGLEVEYGFRKTFYDNFDGLNDVLVDPSDRTWTHNNDWYSFVGIALTFKIFNKMTGCPTYDDVDGKRKR